MQRSIHYLAIASLILVILYEFIKWFIAVYLTPLFVPFMSFMVVAFFIVITVLSLIALFKYKDWKPLIIQVLTVLLWQFFPFTQIVLNIDFKISKEQREAVVEQVNDGTLKPNVAYNSSLIHLPEKYNQISKGGGDIVIEEENGSVSILFFTVRGVLDNFSGYVYSPNDQKPTKNTFDGDIKEIKKLDKNWYWIKSF